MELRLFFILMIWLLTTPKVFALSILGFGQFPAFTVSTGNTQLDKLLSEEIKRQRANNETLQAYKVVAKIARLEGELLTERLKSEGYYDSVLRTQIKEKSVVYKIFSGPQYKIKSIEVLGPGTEAFSKASLPIRVDSPLLAQQILDARASLEAWVTKNLCLLEVKVDYRVSIDSATHRAAVVLRVLNSPKVQFGEVHFTGAPSLKNRFLKRLVGIEQGTCFKKAVIDKARLNLFQTYLFGSVTVELLPPQNDKVDVSFKLVERHQRSVRVGTAYQSDEGLALVLGWEHRNMFGSAERLQIDSRVSKSLQNILFDLRIPKLHKGQQVINYYSEIEREDSTAFLTEEFKLGASVSQFLSKRVRATLGLEWRLSEVKSQQQPEVAIEALTQNEQFSILSLPVSVAYDKRDQALDPTEGFGVSFQVEPNWDLETRSTSFTKTVFSSSFYTSWPKAWWRPTLALRAAAGSIEGESLEAVPATDRFFVGGGGSVRGYPFQSLGPRVDDGPIGGLSFMELGAEVRFRWGDSYGGVIFIDSGGAFDERIPELNDTMRTAVGLGFRYFTSIAPLRIDLAFPQDRRPGIDDSFQFYISLGQAF